MCTLMLTACDSDNDATSDNALLTEGTVITMRNTLEEGGPEGSFPGIFGAPDDAFDETATLSFTEAEFPTALMQSDTAVGDIPGLYRIDIKAAQIAFTVLPAGNDAFWSGVADVFGVFPAGKTDRYYFTFSQPHNITGATSNNSSVKLRIDSETIAVVEIGEGYNLQPGVAWTIDLE